MTCIFTVRQSPAILIPHLLNLVLPPVLLLLPIADYDLVVAGEAREDHIHLENLKCGDYFIFMTGWDTSSNERVSGGIPYSISETSGEIDLEIPVTE